MVEGFDQDASKLAFFESSLMIMDGFMTKMLVLISQIAQNSNLLLERIDTK